MNVYPIICSRCRNMYRLANLDVERGRFGLCPTCSSWTAEDDAALQAEAGTFYGRCLALKVAVSHLRRAVVAEFRAGVERVRARRALRRMERRRPPVKSPHRRQA